MEGEGQEKDSPPVPLQVAQDDAVLPAPQQAVQGDAVLPALQNTKQDEQTSESGIIQEILNYSESSITTTITTTTLKNQFDHTEGLKVVVVDGEILNYSGFEPEDDPPDELFAEKLAVLQNALSPSRCAPGWRGATCLYFAAPEPPLREPVLVLDGEGSGPVNNLCVAERRRKLSP